jgi:hypothetical protein
MAFPVTRANRLDYRAAKWSAEIEGSCARGGGAVNHGSHRVIACARKRTRIQVVHLLAIDDAELRVVIRWLNRQGLIYRTRRRASIFDYLDSRQR